MLITKAAFKVYSSFPAIYSLVPSIGSINQKILDLFLTLKLTVSSETIGMFGVSWEIFLVIISLISKSPLLTGVLSSFILILRPSLNNLIDFCHAKLKVSIRISAKIIS